VFDAFRNKEVIVLGAGQSALEAAVMLHEAGSSVQLMTRCAGASFAPPPPPRRRLRHRILHPMSVLGPSRTGFFLERVPHGFHFLLTDARRTRLTKELYGPWGAWWLAPRFEGKVPQITNSDVLSATERRGRLVLRTRDRHSGVEREREVDHLVSGTGYQTDVDALPFPDRALARRIRRNCR